MKNFVRRWKYFILMYWESCTNIFTTFPFWLRVDRFVVWTNMKTITDTLMLFCLLRIQQWYMEIICGIQCDLTVNLGYSYIWFSYIFYIIFIHKLGISLLNVILLQSYIFLLLVFLNIIHKKFTLQCQCFNCNTQ